tara:strand:+ start:3865 stop:4428 length:564 start_codon:yes stop_codon:yes gene_type:complete
MKKHILSSLALLIVFSISSCSDSAKFEIQKGKIGHLSNKSTIQELSEIFKKDSIVSNLSEGFLGNNPFQDDDEYLIYDKEGKHLLTIVPKEQLDSTSTIKSIQIFDERYKTATGLNIRSTFADIRANNNINKIESSFSSATLFIDDLNITIAIDKEELGLKAFSDQKVNLEQIPDLAKMKSFIIWFH